MSEQQIPGFEIIEKLGAGGMATVWKARQVSLDRVVAIKVLSSQLANDPEDVQMFQSEAQAAAKLKHPGIVQVYDASAGEGLYYFVMEYVAGYTVGDWARRKGPLDEKDALSVAECVADALDYAWDKARIVHCDIKPDNIIVDSDGTVKVADLGLARTLTAMAAEVTDKVMGTPAFMSPEQARGDKDLDFRADIYSLGAMLYYLCTGKLLFEGHDDEAIMEMQLTATDEDPIELNPKLSKSVCWLIEKMLAKQKELRQPTWNAVCADLSRVRKNLMPQGKLLPPDVSTARRSPSRTKARRTRTAGPVARAETSASPAPKIIAGLTAAAVIAMIIFALMRPGANSRSTRNNQHTSAQNTRAARQARRAASEAKVAQMFQSARQWAASNPTSYNDSMQRFERVMMAGKGTKYGQMAHDEMTRLGEARTAAIERVMAELKARCEKLIDAKEYSDAANMYEAYSGPMSTATRTRRMAMANQLHGAEQIMQHKRQKQRVNATQEADETLDEIVSALVSAGIAAATELTAKATANADLVDHHDKFREVGQLLTAATRVDDRILRSFMTQKRKKITVDLTTGKRTFVVKDMKDGKVIGERYVKRGSAVAALPISIGIDDLSVRERLARMGSDDLPDVALVKGLMALNAGHRAHARKYFEKTPEIVRERLLNSVDKAGEARSSKDAETALRIIMKAVDIPVGAYQRDDWLAAVGARKDQGGTMRSISPVLVQYGKKYGETDFARDAKPVLEALAQLVPTAASPSTEIRHVPVRLSPELSGVKDNPSAVLDLFFKKNPRLSRDDSDIEFDSNGDVVTLELRSSMVQDIEPVAALSKLMSFSVIPSDGADTSDKPEEVLLKDISPLRGLKLENIALSNCRVYDLSPLKGMPLKNLDLSGSSARDLSALKGMQLESLDLSHAKAYDFSPLAGMALKYLYLNDTWVKSIPFIREMPLVHLELGNTKVHDFSPLAGLKLHHLNLSGTQFKNTAVLANMPLETLNLMDTKVTDISTLQGKRLAWLDLGKTPVKDFSPLRGMPLTSLSLQQTSFKDMSILKDLPLTSLDLSRTDIDGLWSLKDMRLQSLNIENTSVSSLASLAKLPLQTLSCRDIKAKNYMPLMGKAIHTLWIDGAEDNRNLIRSLSKLRYLNGIDMWNKSDGERDDAYRAGRSSKKRARRAQMPRQKHRRQQ